MRGPFAAGLAVKRALYIFATWALGACAPRGASAPPPREVPSYEAARSPGPAPFDAVRAAPVPAPPVADAAAGVQHGYATFYGARLAGHHTASGERFDPNAMTAAHRTLRLGTWVEVRRSGTDRVVRVRINDRGPFGAQDRIIDLAGGAFARLGSLREGVIPVEVRVVRP